MRLLPDFCHEKLSIYDPPNVSAYNPTRTITLKMNHNRLLSTALILTVAYPSVYADWQLIENFETAVADDLPTWNASADGFWGKNYIVTSDDELPEGVVVEDNNDIFYQDPQHYGEHLSTIYTKIELPNGGVAQGAAATLYCRYFQLGPDHNVNIGLSDIPADLEAEEKRPNAGKMQYGDFEVQLNFDSRVLTSEQQGYFAVRDGSSFVDTETVIPDGEWIDIWMVVYNRVQDGITVHDETELYFATAGGTPTKVLIPNGSGGHYDTFIFRNQTNDPLVAFFVGTYNDTGSGGTPNTNEQWYIDNVQIDYSGENLTVPPNVILGDSGETWAGLPVTSNGWVLTDANYFGWLNVTKKPWVYSSDLEAYLYLPEEYYHTGGSWAYFYDWKDVYLDKGSWYWMGRMITYGFIPSYTEAQTSGWAYIVNIEL